VILVRILAHMVLAQTPAPIPVVAGQLAATIEDSIPRVTLGEALQRATRLNPDYVQALGRVGEAEWARTAARLAFLIPAVNLNLDATRYSTAFFNIGTGSDQQTSVVGTATASYELFSLRKITDLSRTSAELDQAAATEVQRRFNAALVTERAYYQVLQQVELARVSRERVDRATEQLGVARARVLSGAAVQSDSLQLRLEVTRATVQQLLDESALRTARLELGRRVGMPGPVDAAPLDDSDQPDLPLTLPQAVAKSLEQGPAYQIARARERGFAAALRGRRGDYLPTLMLTGTHQRFDDHFFPRGRTVSYINLGINIPVWNLGQRELGIRQARTNADVASAIRADLERAAQRDVGEAYDGYEVSRASSLLAAEAVAVATENYRVQDVRYRGGATTILELIDAQLSLTQAQAVLVQARYANLLTLAALEVILGERLFPERLGGGS
jgi:multidrug efflux system outer membrane protein